MAGHRIRSRGCSLTVRATRTSNSTSRSRGLSTSSEWLCFQAGIASVRSSQRVSPSIRGGNQDLPFATPLQRHRPRPAPGQPVHDSHHGTFDGDDPMLTVVPGDGSGHEGGKDSSSLIDEIVREGARRMLAEALQAEVDAYIAAHAAERDQDGRRLVVRNGHHQPREVLTSAGAVEVTVPRVNDKRTDPDTGERKRFSSAILPPWARKTPKITEVLPLLYLHGLSSGDFVPALGQFLGSSAGLSAAVITRLTETWRAEQRAFAARGLSGVDYVYLWADGIHVNIRLEEHKLCLLVMIGVRADGRKELIALADGYRESAESWADLLARLRPPRDARPGAGGRGRGAGVLERAAGGVPAGQGGPLLVPLRRPRDYADLAAGAAGGGLMSGGKVGIIRGLRGRRAGCRGAGSGRAWCRVGWSGRGLVL